MDVQQIKDYVLKSGHMRLDDVNDGQFETYLNIEYHALEDAIKTKVRGDYFTGTFITDLVADQSQYSFEVSGGDTNGMEKIVTVDVNDGSVAKPKRKRYPYFSNEDFGRTTENMKTRPPKFVDIKGSSIFLYPKPKSHVVEGLKVQAVISLKDLKISDTEANIFPGHSELRKYHHLLGIGVRKHYLQSKLLLDERDHTEAHYVREVEKMIRSLIGRYDGVIMQEPYNLTYFAR